MNFYDYIHILSYLFTYIGNVRSVSNIDLKTSKIGIEDISPCAVGLKLYAVVNNTSSVNDYEVELLPDQCCLELDNNIDCDMFQAYGNCIENLPKGSTKAFTIVVPILDPYERKGYCLANLDSKAVHRNNKVVTMRDSIKIPFNTRLKNYKHLPLGIQHCKGKDEDPLNQCQQVNCETFYNGNKSFYDKIQKICVEVPHCIRHKRDITKNLILDPLSNRCLTDEPITKDDIDYIQSMKHSNKGRIIKDIVIIQKTKNGPINVTEFFEKVPANDKPSFIENHTLFCRNWNPSNVLSMMNTNKFGVIFLFVIIALQCGLICTMVYYIAKICFSKKGTVVEKKYFNYKQDASVTTPLIGMTTIETATTCQFTSESSHIEKKIQCYKACRKENAQTSLSDDILTKCLNRRNWDRRQQVKSEAVDNTPDNSKAFETLYVSAKKDEKLDEFKSDAEVKKTTEDLTTNLRERSTNGGDKNLSEREIQCLTYSYKDSKPQLSEQSFLDKGTNCHSYNYGMETHEGNSLQTSSHSYSEINNKNKKRRLFKPVNRAGSNVSIGRQASAQVSFTNDSIDDYLSERGMMFMAGDDMSRYSFSDASVKSSVTSKTSKNIIMKHVLSYLKRDRHRPSSYPGEKKNKDVNLELIHMSKATMYSSSNNGTECVKNISKFKDSRTSL